MVILATGTYSENFPQPSISNYVDPNEELCQEHGTESRNAHDKVGDIKTQGMWHFLLVLSIVQIVL